jgi:probable F420-dependent oxidoreductase
MEIGCKMNSHGLIVRGNTDFRLENIDALEMRPLQFAHLVERAGYHSLWFSDHVTLPLQTVPVHFANPESGERHYVERPQMLDALTTMAAVAAVTERVKLATAALIAPYRPPLHDARQLATVDWLSNGRLIAGVGAGWAKEEFAALGLDYERRGDQTDECIQIYKTSWEDETPHFDGEFYKFSNITMDPKPVQKPRPPIVFGSTSKAGARRAARLCDGFYPIFMHPAARPHDLDHLLDEIRCEAERVGKDLTKFMLVAEISARLTTADDPSLKRDLRPICEGTAEMILSDLQSFAEAGYSLAVIHQDCRDTRSADELVERVEQFGQEIIPTAKTFQPGGEWMPVPV